MSVERQNEGVPIRPTLLVLYREPQGTTYRVTNTHHSVQYRTAYPESFYFVLSYQYFLNL